MATITVKRAEPTPPPVIEITLKLSVAEAAVIHFLVGNLVTGDSTETPRQHSDKVWDALRSVPEVVEEAERVREQFGEDYSPVFFRRVTRGHAS
jgi:hypothetical protein